MLLEFKMSLAAGFQRRFARFARYTNGRMAFQALSKWISSAYLDPEQLEALAMAGFLEALRIMSSSFWADWKTGFSGGSEMFSATLAQIGSCLFFAFALALRCGNLLSCRQMV